MELRLRGENTRGRSRDPKALRKKKRRAHLHRDLGVADDFDSGETPGRGVLFDPVVQC